MTTTSFDQVWEATRSLTPDELRKVRNLIDAVLANPALRADMEQLSKEDQVDLCLLKEGLLIRIPPPLTQADIETFRQWQPVTIEGKPISETIIEERR